jgi:hypothetical protein
MDPRTHAFDNLAHARWRVNFIRHLLHAHLASPWIHTREWQEQHAEFLHRLAAAEDELKICKQVSELRMAAGEPCQGAQGKEEREGRPGR